MDHAPFIWSAYGLSALVLAWTALAPMLRRRRALERLKQANPAESIDDTDT